MAWVHGNDPTGFQIREGRILCEAMYAINEREYCCNLAITNWTDAGAWPAVNALAGLDVTVARKGTLIVEMRAAIEGVLNSFLVTGIIFYPVGEEDVLNYYTKAILLTEAFGAANWCVLTGQAINYGWAISQILLAVELLTSVVYSADGAADNKYSLKRWNGVVGTPALARAQCDAQAPAAWAAGFFWSQERVDAAPPNYDYYDIFEEVDRIDVYIPPSAAIGTAYYWYITGGALAGHDTAGTKLFYEITAGIFAAPGWGAEGTLRHTIDEIPAAINTPKLEVLDDSSFLGTGANTYYTKTIENVATPFVDDNTTQVCRITQYGLRFDLTFLYN